MVCRCDEIGKHKRDINKIERKLSSLKTVERKLSTLKRTRSRLVKSERRAYVVSALCDRTLDNKAKNRGTKSDNALTYARQKLSSHLSYLKNTLTALEAEDKAFHA
jgi:prefoldin subunit 5